MIKRTFLNKTNTIRKGSYENFGLHPICMLNYGLDTTRFLIEFDITEIRKFASSAQPDEPCKHILKMTNCGSIDLKKYGIGIPSNDTKGIKKRAVSYTLYAFPVNEEWDEGIGFDNEADFWLSGASSVSTEASNWFYRQSGYKWLKNGCVGEEPNVSEAVAFQHFDHGNENLELDITDYVNEQIQDETVDKISLCIIFDPELENRTSETGIIEDNISEQEAQNNCGVKTNFVKHLRTELNNNIDNVLEYTQYVGFFGNKTNTFFEPVVESRIYDCIKDDRYNFILNKTNRLYLYACTDGEFLELDEMPTCTIDNPYSCNGSGTIECDVKKQFPGVYYAEIMLDNNSCKPDTVLCDTWSNLIYNGEVIDDVEMDFVTHPSQAKFSIGPDIQSDSILEPSLSGINDDEVLHDGDVRKVNVKFRIPYSTNYKTLNNTEYRIYTKDKNREYDVIEWDGINNAGEINYFIIKSSELVPGDYFVDIKVQTKQQTKTFKNVLSFKKENNITRITR